MVYEQLPSFVKFLLSKTAPNIVAQMKEFDQRFDHNFFKGTESDFEKVAYIENHLRKLGYKKQFYDVEGDKSNPNNKKLAPNHHFKHDRPLPYDDDRYYVFRVYTLQVDPVYQINLRFNADGDNNTCAEFEYALVEKRNNYFKMFRVDCNLNEDSKEKLADSFEAILPKVKQEIQKRLDNDLRKEREKEEKIQAKIQEQLRQEQLKQEQLRQEQLKQEQLQQEKLRQEEEILKQEELKHPTLQMKLELSRSCEIDLKEDEYKTFSPSCSIS